MRCLCPPAPAEKFDQQPISQYISAHLTAQQETETLAKKSTKQPDFESALAELETLVETMEAGDLSLEESLKQFERGISLTRGCQASLQEAEQKVQILLNKTGAPEPFEKGSDE